MKNAAKMAMAVLLLASTGTHAFVLSGATAGRRPATFAPSTHAIGSTALQFIPGTVPSTSYTPRMSETEEDAVLLINKAREFAFSDSTHDPKMARSFLQHILYVQSRCAAGTLSGSDVCEVDTDMIDLVRQLKEKCGSVGHGGNYVIAGTCQMTV